MHSLPEGYDTVLDSEAGNISAGEKQLLTIARAFISDPALLILDEATSSVDTRTELLVQQGMANLRQDRTSFVIAHRLSTIRDADLIPVMEDGRIVEQGSRRVARARGAFARLYAAQFAGALTEDAEAGRVRSREESPFTDAVPRRGVSGGRAVEFSGATVGGEFDVLVVPLRGAVDAGDECAAVHPAEVTDAEGETSLVSSEALRSARGASDRRPPSRAAPGRRSRSQRRDSPRSMCSAGRSGAC